MVMNAGYVVTSDEWDDDDDVGRCNGSERSRLDGSGCWMVDVLVMRQAELDP